jgi:hypothetical protein
MKRMLIVSLLLHASSYAMVKDIADHLLQEGNEVVKPDVVALLYNDGLIPESAQISLKEAVAKDTFTKIGSDTYTMCWGYNGPQWSKEPNVKAGTTLLERLFRKSVNPNAQVDTIVATSGGFPYLAQVFVAVKKLHTNTPARRLIIRMSGQRFFDQNIGGYSIEEYQKISGLFGAGNALERVTQATRPQDEKSLVALMVQASDIPDMNVECIPSDFFEERRSFSQYIGSIAEPMKVAVASSYTTLENHLLEYDALSRLNPHWQVVSGETEVHNTQIALAVLASEKYPQRAYYVSRSRFASILESLSKELSNS